MMIDVCINDEIIKEMEAKLHPVQYMRQSPCRLVSGKESEVLTFAPIPEKHLVRTEWEHSDSLLRMRSLRFRKMRQIYVKRVKHRQAMQIYQPKIKYIPSQAFCIPCPAWSSEGMKQRKAEAIEGEQRACEACEVVHRSIHSGTNKRHCSQSLSEAHDALVWMKPCQQGRQRHEALDGRWAKDSTSCFILPG